MTTPSSQSFARATAYEPPPASPPPRWAGSSYQSGGMGKGGGTSFSSEDGPSFATQGQGQAGPSQTTPWTGGSGGRGEAGFGNTRVAASMDTYETTHGWRLDVSSALTYAFPPFTSLFFLLTEVTNSFVRFHAWQSALLFACITAINLVVSVLSSTLLKLFMFADVCLLVFMARQAFIDSDVLARYHVPYIGPIAHQWVEEE